MNIVFIPTSHILAQNKREERKQSRAFFCKGDETVRKKDLCSSHQGTEGPFIACIESFI